MILSVRHAVFTFAMVSAAFTSATLLTGCDSSSANKNEYNDATLSQTYADNWSVIEIDANLAKTKVTSTGHYETSKNACSRPGDGAMTLEEWNAFASDVNSAVKTLNPTAPKICIPIDYRACMDGTATLVRDDGTKIPLFEPGQPGEACTHLQDQTLAQNLYKSINGLTYAADRAGCSLEYERCTR